MGRPAKYFTIQQRIEAKEQCYKNRKLTPEQKTRKVESTRSLRKEKKRKLASNKWRDTTERTDELFEELIANADGMSSILIHD
jgi:hypothetical protein